jgi:hypothetical protein
VSDLESKGVPDPGKPFREVEGFRRSEGEARRVPPAPAPGAPNSNAAQYAHADQRQRDHGDDQPSAGTTKTTSQRRRQKAKRQPLVGPEGALHGNAAEQARQLKRTHRALYASDPRRFRKIVRDAQSAVFRQKPGPKQDLDAARRIARAAGRRARGARWPELYPQYIIGYQELNHVTRGYAEDGFRRRVNKYLQSHRRLRKPETGTVAHNPG